MSGALKMHKLYESHKHGKEVTNKQQNCDHTSLGLQLDLKEQAPRPLSAPLYQCLINASLTSGLLIQLYRDAVTTISAKTSVETIWPKCRVDTKRSRKDSLLNHCHSSLFYNVGEIHMSTQEQPEFLQNDLSVLSEEMQDLVFSDNIIDACASSFLPAETKPDLFSDETCLSLQNSFTISRNECCQPLDKNVTPEITACQTSFTFKVESGTNSMPFNFINGEKSGTPVNSDIELKFVEYSSEDSVNAEDMIVTELNLPSEQKTDYCQDTFFNEVFRSQNYLEIKPLKKAFSLPPIEETFTIFHHESQDTMDQPEILTSCAFPETLLEPKEQIHEHECFLKDEELSQRSTSLASLRTSLMEIDFNLARRASHPHQLQVSLGTSLSTFNSSEKSREKLISDSRNTETKEVVSFRTTSDKVGDCKLGSWWKQGLETRRASTGLLPAIEQVPAVRKDKAATLVSGCPNRCFYQDVLQGSINEVKQAVKQRSSSRRNKSKRGKQVKQA